MDIVLRESERLNTTIRSFLAYARPQRFAIARFDLRRVAQRHRAAAAQQRRRARRAHAIDVDVPADPSSGSRPTRTRSSRSSGTWPPTACGRCPTADGCAAGSAHRPTATGVVITVQDAGHRHRRPKSSTGLFQPFHGTLRQGQRPRAGHRAPHRHRLQRRDSRSSSHAGRRHDACRCACRRARR